MASETGDCLDAPIRGNIRIRSVQCNIEESEWLKGFFRWFNHFPTFRTPLKSLDHSELLDSLKFFLVLKNLKFKLFQSYYFT